MWKTFKILLLSAVLAVGSFGCTTKYPPTEDDRGVVAPETISDEKSQSGAPVLPYYSPWWL